MFPLIMLNIVMSLRCWRLTRRRGKSRHTSWIHIYHILYITSVTEAKQQIIGLFAGSHGSSIPSSMTSNRVNNYENTKVAMVAYTRLEIIMLLIFAIILSLDFTAIILPVFCHYAHIILKFKKCGKKIARYKLTQQKSDAY